MTQGLKWHYTLLADKPFNSEWTLLKPGPRRTDTYKCNLNLNLHITTFLIWFSFYGSFQIFCEKMSWVFVSFVSQTKDNEEPKHACKEDMNNTSILQFNISFLHKNSHGAKLAMLAPIPAII
ncbi:hypothetical protein HanRHA438_Chr16g0771491 [Helianthus annuus]|nr:hypothetical protein HanRHA438_Chr16g0771491 [Helianthus annuus]